MNDTPVTVLFVDDEPSVLRALRRLLKSQPWETLFAESADGAMSIMRSRGADILVTDIDMPGTTGLELLRMVRLEYPKTVRMLLTGTATLERALDAINFGEVARFYTKPFDVDELLGSLREMVSRIEASRREREPYEQAKRREELEAWAEGRWPGVLAVTRSREGVVELDADAIDEALAPLGALRGILLRRD